MIETRKTPEAGKTPAQITVSMIDQDLKDGISKPDMAIKYGIKPWEVDEMFKHPFLKGRRPSRKKTLSFSFIDDIEPLDNGTIIAKQDTEVEEVNPNQVTLEQAIDDAIETVEEVKTELKETEATIVEMLSPTEYTTVEEDLINIADETTKEEIELREDEETFEL